MTHFGLKLLNLKREKHQVFNFGILRNIEVVFEFVKYLKCLLECFNTSKLLLRNTSDLVLNRCCEGFDCDRVSGILRDLKYISYFLLKISKYVIDLTSLKRRSI
jgi:hypothetical protein